MRLQRKSRIPGVKILNSRGEYNRCKLVRLQVADEFKDPNDQSGGAKYTLLDKLRKKAKPNDNEDFKNRKDKPKLNVSTNDGDDQVNFQSNKANNLKYTLNSNKAAAQQKESKPNMVEVGEVNKQPRRVYKYVANNFRFREKFDVEKPIYHSTKD